MEPGTFPPRSRFQTKNETRLPNKFGSPSSSRVPSYTHFLNQTTKSKFIGSFIHEYSADSRLKHRPSKRARQRIRKRLAKLELEDKGSKTSPESGYDTTSGDCQTPGLSSLEKRTFALEEDNSPEGKNLVSEQTSNQPHERKDTVSNSRGAMSGNAGSLITDQTLRRLLKDLHRCEVSIVKYESMLSEKCQEGQNVLRDVFAGLRCHIDTRESDLRQELTNVGENAATILERRKNTALYLKQAAEHVNNLEDVQRAELKQQIKQFVTDRRVDEEIGTITRFQADPDDILPHIMGFGKVNNVRHLYTEWEENPEEAIEMSKHRLSFPVSTLGSYRFSVSSSLGETDSSPTHSAKSDTSDSQANSSIAVTGPSQCAILASRNEAEKMETVDEPAVEQVATSKQSNSLTSLKNVQAKACAADEKVLTESMSMEDVPVRVESSPERNEPELKRDTLKPTFPAKTEFPKIEEMKEETYPLQEEKHPLQEEEQLGGDDKDPPRIPAAELIMKQSRVRESLKMQGVFLYDPITGEGPPPTPPPPATPTDTNTVVDIEPPTSPIARKKKTPTQLRRERKKRQKERERRQTELERKLREDSTKSSSSSSLECKHSEVSTTDKSSNGSGVDEESSPKHEWGHLSAGPHTAEERDASGESSENEQTTEQRTVTPLETPDTTCQQEAPGSPTHQELALEGAAISTDQEGPSITDKEVAAISTNQEEGPSITDKEVAAISTDQEGPSITDKEVAAISTDQEEGPSITDKEVAAISTDQEGPSITDKEVAAISIDQEEGPSMIDSKLAADQTVTTTSEELSSSRKEKSTSDSEATDSQVIEFIATGPISSSRLPSDEAHAKAEDLSTTTDTASPPANMAASQPIVSVEEEQIHIPTNSPPNDNSASSSSPQGDSVSAYVPPGEDMPPLRTIPLLKQLATAAAADRDVRHECANEATPLLGDSEKEQLNGMEPLVNGMEPLVNGMEPLVDSKEQRDDAEPGEAAQGTQNEASSATETPHTTPGSHEKDAENLPKIKTNITDSDSQVTAPPTVSGTGMTSGEESNGLSQETDKIISDLSGQILDMSVIVREE